MHSPHLARRSDIIELRGALEELQGQFKAVLPSAGALVATWHFGWL
jgi:hypothetical protein